MSNATATPTETPKADAKGSKSKQAKQAKADAKQAKQAKTEAENQEMSGLSPEEFAALPEKMQNRIRAYQEKRAAAEMGRTIFQSLIKRLIEMGYIESEEQEKVRTVTIDTDGNVKIGNKRKKRTIATSDDTDEDEGEDTDEDEDEDGDEEEESYAETLADALQTWAEEEGLTQTHIRSKLKPRGRSKLKAPSQATISNWLRGKVLPNRRYHNRLERVLSKAGYLD